MKPIYSLPEWELIIWSYAYESRHYSHVDDHTFDGAAYRLKRPTAIPDFAPHTGQWVHTVVASHGPELTEFLDAAVAKLRRLGRGAAVWHVKFPEGWLNPIPPWPMPDAYDHI